MHSLALPCVNSRCTHDAHQAASQVITHMMLLPHCLAIALTVTVPVEHALAAGKRFNPCAIELQDRIGFLSTFAVKRYVAFVLAANESRAHGVLHMDEDSRMSVFIVRADAHDKHVFTAGLGPYTDDDSWEDAQACALCWYTECYGEPHVRGVL